MAIALYFQPASMSAQQYDETIRRLDAAGQGRPAGRLHHSCFGPEDRLMVYDVWESQRAFDEFGKTLIPILQDLGIDPGQPDVMPVHNMIGWSWGSYFLAMAASLSWCKGVPVPAIVTSVDIDTSRQAEAAAMLNDMVMPMAKAATGFAGG